MKIYKTGIQMIWMRLPCPTSEMYVNLSLNYNTLDSITAYALIYLDFVFVAVVLDFCISKFCISYLLLFKARKQEYCVKHPVSFAIVLVLYQFHFRFTLCLSGPSI